LRQFVAAQIAFSRLVKFKYKAEFKLDTSEVDRRYNKERSGIRAEIDGKIAKYMGQFDKLKPVTVYHLQEVLFPLEGGATEEVMQARAIDAVQYARGFRNCKNLRGPASGIFNVKYGRKLEADASKLPGPLKGVLDSKGPNTALCAWAIRSRFLLFVRSN
jgi:peptidyl-prolyl cis-trans isomerase SurA